MGLPNSRGNQELQKDGRRQGHLAMRGFEEWSMTGKLVCHCFGVSDERRRTGIHTDLFSGTPMLGILNVDALRGVTEKEAQAFRTIGIECVRDLAAIDPSTLLSAMPVSPWRI